MFIFFSLFSLGNSDQQKYEVSALYVDNASKIWVAVMLGEVPAFLPSFFPSRGYNLKRSFISGQIIIEIYLHFEYAYDTKTHVYIK